MQLPLEDLEYQRGAVAAVVGLFQGQGKNTLDNSNLFGIQANVTDLPPTQAEENKRQIVEQNGILLEDAKLSTDTDICIEMETGTGKTVVYLRTIYELYVHYRFTKFIVLVPSIAIKEAVIAAFDAFRCPLADRYNFTPAFFEYSSSKLSRLRHFVEDTQPQIMVMTVQSIIADDRIINQRDRDDSFFGMTYLEALGKCQPIVVMDEPQEGMDTDAAVSRLKTLNPLVRLRYSATHKVVKNLLFRLTPFDAYKQGIVKKIEVLSVAEKNDEATLKIELRHVLSGPSRDPKAKLKLWRQTGAVFKWQETKWLKKGAKLDEASGNTSYRDFTIERIYKSLQDGKFHVRFTNGVEIVESERSADFSGIFRQQLQWLIRRHFQKKLGLNEGGQKVRPSLPDRGIKPLSLIFIDRVDNYVKDDGIIKRLFCEEYAGVYRDLFGVVPTPNQITSSQGFYFAKTTADEYTDSEVAMLKNKEVFDLILRGKEELLRLDNPVEFIFSHSALGVGWDNPNIFNIATLNQSYSESKKRQEIGRGLRICRDQSGKRVYDPDGTPQGEETNLLTIVPNETYQTFVEQYQQQISEVYGTTAAASQLRMRHKGRDSKQSITRTNLFDSSAFRGFWEKLARKTDYAVVLREDQIVARAAEAISRLAVSAYEAEIVLTRIKGIFASSIASEEIGRETEKLKATFSPIDLIEEISENTALSYAAVLQIVRELSNFESVIRNPPKFVAEACSLIRAIELDEMLRSLSYHPTGESLPLSLFEEVVQTYDPIAPTPNRGVYDHVVCSQNSTPEREFARHADIDAEVICFLKLPAFYEIPTPIGMYRPDFGLVLKRSGLRGNIASDYYFVIETKGTNNINDSKALTESERLKIRCAFKHFDALGIEAHLDYAVYQAPVADYHSDFKNKIVPSCANS